MPYADSYRADAVNRLASGGSPSGRVDRPSRPAWSAQPTTAAPSVQQPSAPPQPRRARPAAPAAAPRLPPIQSVTTAPPPDADATFAAFLRGLGQQESSAFRNAAMQLSQSASQRDVTLDDLAIALGDRNRNIGLSWENRGFGNSGMETYDRAIARRDYNRDTADAQRAWANAQAQIRQQNADQIADLARRRADAELELLSRNEARRAGGVKV
jgi:hypothetical protein